MGENYRNDILEKFMQFGALVYLVFGFFMNYAWICVKLDFRTDISNVLIFWEPIAGIQGVLNIAHLVLIGYSVHIIMKNSTRPESLNINLLFYILVVPLFLASVSFIAFIIVYEIYFVNVVGGYTIFMRFGEVAFFSGTMVFIVIINIRNQNSSNLDIKRLTNFVTLISTVEMVIYFMFHTVSQQIINFIEVASNYSEYAMFYNKSILNRDIGNLTFQFDKVRNYMQPLVILFCCVCTIYLIVLMDFKQSDGTNSETESEGDLVPFLDSVASLPSEIQYRSNNISKMTIYNLRLPPVSLLLGILLVTVSLLIIILSNSFINMPNLFKVGQLISVNFCTVVYVLAIILLLIQINEMKRWEKLKKNENIVDKILVWIGVPGQLIISIAQIKLNIFRYDASLSQFILLEFSILICQIALQFIVVMLALDRKWIPPPIKTWQEFICPSVGIFSINLGMLMFSVFDITNNKSIEKFSGDKFLFINIFGSGFQSFGETLSILQRLHSLLIFGKIVIVTNR